MKTIQLKWSDEAEWKDFRAADPAKSDRENLDKVRAEWAADRMKYGLKHNCDFRIVGLSMAGALMKFALTEYVVKATHCEHFLLWEKHSGEVAWEQHTFGYLKEIGICAGRPVVVECEWATINGHLIMFYDATSQVVDREMIDQWLKDNCNPQHRGRRAHCDANNFDFVLNMVQQKVQE